MLPSLPSITRARYWIVVALRILSLLVLGYAAVLAWQPVSRSVISALFDPTRRLSPSFLAIQILVGPGALALGALVCLRSAPALARWLVPLPRPGCPECGYQTAAGTQRCPECGAPLAPAS